MNVPQDWIIQANLLATCDPKRPKQINLRRAVSVAYYGLFHFLIDAACRQAVGAQHSQSPIRHALGRAFSHNTMRDACNWFQHNHAHPAVTSRLGTFLVPDPIRKLAVAFMELQEKRHYADYDQAIGFSRFEVLEAIQELDRTVSDFQALPDSNERRLFLISLLNKDHLSKLTLPLPR